ncbi:MAG: HemK/PrmC family methyltransferase [Nocardioidaceae bacterium]
MSFEATVERLRGAGSVFAEAEAVLLLAWGGARVEELLGRRSAGVPLEHLIGRADFGGLPLRVGPGTFVPRTRTLLLAERIAAVCRPGDRVLDLCCGVGAIGVYLRAVVPELEIVGADSDPEAVRWARVNGLTAYAGDLYAALPPGERFDVIVANAPYVPADGIGLMPGEARDHEPRPTLDGGDDGLRVIARIVEEAPAQLRPSGVLGFEVSSAQAEPAVALFDGQWDAPELHRDDLGTVAVLTRRVAAAR